jgi:hypothetical protein
MRFKLADSTTQANNRYFAYSAGGLLLGEYTITGGTAAWKRDVVYLDSDPIIEVDSSGVHELVGPEKPHQTD